MKKINLHEALTFARQNVRKLLPEDGKTVMSAREAQLLFSGLLLMQLSEEHGVPNDAYYDGHIVEADAKSLKELNDAVGRNFGKPYNEIDVVVHFDYVNDYYRVERVK